jgi:uncharacterized protein YbaR (Trm112 family)
MMCTWCPKCSAEIELDLPPVTEEGTSVACPACKARLWVFKESFAARAFRKTKEISCEKCGKELGHSTYCPSCGALFPDYLVVSAGRKRVRKVTIIKEIRTPKRGRSEFAAHWPGAATLPVSQKPGKNTHKTFLITVSLLVLAIVVSFGIHAYKQNIAEKQYTANYLRALYCIKTAADRSLKTCAKISAGWKANLDAGRNVNPRVSAEDEADLNKVSGEIDKYMQKLNPPPQKFVSTNETLANLNGVVTRLQSLAVAPSGSLQTFTDSAGKLDSEYKKAAQELKASLPGKLAEELKKAGVKYKGLSDF